MGGEDGEKEVVVLVCAVEKWGIAKVVSLYKQKVLLLKTREGSNVETGVLHPHRKGQ